MSNEDQEQADDERDLNVRQMKREENRIAIPDYQEKKRKKETKQTFIWLLSMVIECDQPIDCSCIDPTSE